MQQPTDSSTEMREHPGGKGADKGCNPWQQFPSNPQTTPGCSEGLICRRVELETSRNFRLDFLRLQQKSQTRSWVLQETGSCIWQKKTSLLRVKKLCWDSPLNSRPKDGIPQCIVALVSKKSMGWISLLRYSNSPFAYTGSPNGWTPKMRVPFSGASR